MEPAEAKKKPVVSLAVRQTGSFAGCLPYFDLSLGQIEGVRDLDAFSARQILAVVEFLLQLDGLIASVRLSGALGALGNVCNRKAIWLNVVLASTIECSHKPPFWSAHSSHDSSFLLTSFGDVGGVEMFSMKQLLIGLLAGSDDGANSDAA